MAHETRMQDAPRLPRADTSEEKGRGQGRGVIWRGAARAILLRLRHRWRGRSRRGTPRPARASVMQRVILPEQLFLCGAAVWSTAAALSNASNSQRGFGIAGAISGAELGKDGGEYGSCRLCSRGGVECRAHHPTPILTMCQAGRGAGGHAEPGACRAPGPRRRGGEGGEGERRRAA